jgi:hypothetical protein
MLGTVKKKTNVGLTALLLALYMAAMILAPAQPAHAQGCIVARLSSQTISPESQGVSATRRLGAERRHYRQQFSYKHFVGDVEQTYRVPAGHRGDE